MDLKQIGTLIKEQRKQKNLTQSQLAQKLCVSEKTISKWECGGGFPDSSLMLPLCQELGLSANELLSGKKIKDEEYKKEAEQNLIDLKTKDEDKTKFILKLEVVIGTLASIFFLTLIFIASYVSIPTWLRIVLIVSGLIVFITGVHFCLLIEKDAGFYECPHCHNKYTPTYSQVIWSMHIGRDRHMKCPNCGKKGWNKKVVK